MLVEVDVVILLALQLPSQFSGGHVLQGPLLRAGVELVICHVDVPYLLL